MSFAEAIETCLTKYVDVKGRATRPEYWWFFLAVVSAYLLALLLGSATSSEFGAFLAFIILLGSFLPLLAAAVRRLHDTGRSGWWYLIGLTVCRRHRLARVTCARGPVRSESIRPSRR
jgi:uncharacterized membrane protein YhaH (DUF805 family)